MEKKHVAGIVVYHPDYERLSQNIISIFPQVDDLILYCNSFVDSTKIPDNGYVWLNRVNSTNKGVAHALNKIMEKAELLHAEWCLLLDQDSVVPQDIIEKYEKAILNRDTAKTAVLCPQIMNEGSKDTIDGAECMDEVAYCITSASYNHIKTWRFLGGFREDFFIDYVDWEYCARARENGFGIHRLNSVILDHQLGKISYHTFFGKEIYTFNHNSFRKYYITRNTLMAHCLYPNEMGFRHPYLRIFKRMMIAVMYEDDKLKKSCAIARGVKDFFAWRKKNMRLAMHDKQNRNLGDK